MRGAFIKQRYILLLKERNQGHTGSKPANMRPPGDTFCTDGKRDKLEQHPANQQPACWQKHRNPAEHQRQYLHPGVQDDVGAHIVGGTPEWTVYVSGQVSHRLADGNLFYGQLDVNWKDENPSGNDNDQNKYADSYTLTNLRLGYRFSGDRYDVSLWAKNVFDEDYTNGAFNSVIREGSLTEYHTEPQSWGVTLRATL